MSATLTVAARRPFEFGSDARLTGMITDPRHGASGVGAVIFGMGSAEVRAARLLAQHGIVVLQVRQKDEIEGWHAAQNASGVRRCKESIELLREQRGVERFICMGNCGKASIVFRVALEDPRVVGLILTNPHISPALTIRESYAKRLLSAKSWRRLLAGKANFAYHVPNLRLLAMALFGRFIRVDEKALINRSGHNEDLTIPDRFDERLRGLTRRGVKVLLAFSQNDEGLSYFRKLYGQSFEKVSRIPGVSFDLIRTDTHILSNDDAAAGTLMRLIARWIEDAAFTSSAPQVEAIDRRYV
jgi:pimeloyl-ACP methyl ester carboxylesterase